MTVELVVNYVNTKSKTFTWRKLTEGAPMGRMLINKVSSKQAEVYILVFFKLFWYRKIFFDNAYIWRFIVDAIAAKTRLSNTNNGIGNPILESPYRQPNKQADVLL